MQRRKLVAETPGLDWTGLPQRQRRGVRCTPALILTHNQSPVDRLMSRRQEMNQSSSAIKLLVGWEETGLKA
ncbi:uncharacterized protein TrAFT101_009870 [Trichoderma asperellum]|uniref:uncharacterized protein n=1 Tax=Trichoderma asperellum TaxID=101201 RepID=UPI00332959D7|nr:hypothetical protein TrAFT101_009870 [Trichoderma asperellum]